MNLELRFYLVEINDSEEDVTSLSDEKFIELAEELGFVYSLEGFIEAFNDSDVNTNTDIMRAFWINLYDGGMVVSNYAGCEEIDGVKII